MVNIFSIGNSSQLVQFGLLINVKWGWLSMAEQLRARAQRLENWIKNEAIPLWLARGIAPTTGAHYERLTAAGDTDLESNLRMRVQARQAFFYASAYSRGWCKQGQTIAQQLLSFVAEHARVPSTTAGYAHLLDKHFQIIDQKQDLYDHAFILLAFAWAYRNSQDAQYLRDAEQLVAHLDTQFSSPHGGWLEGDYAYECRRQNPHMHLLEAFLALYDASNNPQWLARADDMIKLFEAHFFDAEHSVLYEFFQDDWQRLPDARGAIVEPGHMLEWVWLLNAYGQRRHKDMSRYTTALYARALAIGIAPSGLVLSAVTADGRVLDANKRCWGMTEFIKASLVQMRAGHPQAEAIAVKAVDDLFRYFLCASTAGSYIDQRGVNDEVVVDLAPASTLYHIMVAATELVDYTA